MRVLRASITYTRQCRVPSVQISKRVRPAADERVVAGLLGRWTEQIGQTGVPPGHAGASLHAAGEGGGARAERSFDNHQRDPRRVKHRGQLYRQHDEGCRDLELSAERATLRVVHHLQEYLR